MKVKETLVKQNCKECGLSFTQTFVEFKRSHFKLCTSCCMKWSERHDIDAR